MLVHETTLRVRYGETDRMGYVYYGNHALYFEVGRGELLRHIGYPYNIMEAEGVICPVTAIDVRYVRPALYEDLLVLKTTIRQLPTQYVVFETEIYNEKNKLISAGKVTLAFADAHTRKKCDPPARLLAALAPYFEAET